MRQKTLDHLVALATITTLNLMAAQSYPHIKWVYFPLANSVSIYGYWRACAKV